MMKSTVRTLVAAALAAAALLEPGSAVAADAPALNGGDTAWMLTSTALVLFMTLPGLALFYGGLVRAKNVLSVLMHCFAIACMVSVLWALYAYSLATPASGYVGPGGAVVIGLMAGVLCFLATNFMKRSLKVDDSLDVFPVHGVGGMLGTLLAGIFASSSLGLFSGQGYAEGMTMASQVGVQITGIVAVAVYTAVVTAILLKLVDAVAGLRVSAEEETMGLDLALHDERGYSL